MFIKENIVPCPWSGPNKIISNNQVHFVPISCHVFSVSFQSRRYDSRTTIFSPEGKSSWLKRPMDGCKLQVLDALTSVLVEARSERPWFISISRPFLFCGCILVLTTLCGIARASVSGRVRHGGHRPRRHLPGDFSQWRSAAGGREEEHSQAAGRSVFLRENLQAERVSWFLWSKRCSVRTFFFSL